MYLEKAIEIGEDLLLETPQFPPDDRRDALTLLIEAGKRIKGYRDYTVSLTLGLLPGETGLR